MGGFRFQGPNYRIESLPSYPMCRCMGFHGQISEAIETMLVNKPDKMLVLTELPQYLQEEMSKHHLGNTMRYELIHKSKYTRDVTQEREDMLRNIQYETRESELLASRKDGASWDSMFAPLV